MLMIMFWHICGCSQRAQPTLLGKLNSGKSVIAIATFPAKQLPAVLLSAPPMIKLFALNFEAADEPLIVSAV